MSTLMKRPLTKSAFSIVALALTIGQMSVSAQTSDLEVSFVNGNEIAAESGSVSTLVYRVTTPIPGVRSLLSSVSLPPGWITIGAPLPLEVSGPGSAIGFISVRIPASSVADRYDLELTVQDADRLSPGTTGTVTVVIETTHGLELSIPSPTEYVRAGDDVAVSVVIRNLGNAPISVWLDATGPPEAGARLDSTRVRLAPTSSRTLLLTMTTNERITRETLYETYIRAEAEGNDRSFVSATSRIHVIPLFATSEGGATSEPVQITLQSVGDERGAGGQLGASSSFGAFGGTLDFDMLVANRRNIPMFGSRDTYRLAYSTEQFALRLGDQVQYLSPLTSTGDYGAGAGMEFNSGRLFVKGFAQRTRYMLPAQRLAGGSLGLRAGNSTKLTVNALNRVGAYAGTIVSARGEFSPFSPRHTMDLECGLDSGTDFGEPSCSLDVVGRTSGLTYRGRLLNTSSTYPGTRSGTTEQSARLTYRLPVGLTADGNIRRQDIGISTDFGRSSLRYQIGVGFANRKGKVRASSRISFLSRTWSFDTPTTVSDRSENAVQVQFGIQTHRFDLRGTANLGRSWSDSFGYSGTGKRYNLSGRLFFGQRLTLSATGEKASGYLNGSTQPSERWMLNFRAATRIGMRTEMSASVYRNVIGSIYRQPYTSLKAQAKHTLRSGHMITLQAQYSSIAGTRPVEATDYRLSYSFPIGLPVGAPVVRGAEMIGRIYDADTGAGMDGILLFLGDAASISDASGAFKIPRPRSGKAYLSIDQRSIGYENVTLVAMPFEVSSEDDPSFLLDIPVVRAAAVRGSVNLFGSRSGQRLLGDTAGSSTRLAGLGNVVIGLSSAGHEYRGRTGSEGTFEIRNVVPGDYVVRILAGPQLSHHGFEPDFVHVSLVAGERSSVEFRAIPIIPEIRMMRPAGGAIAVLETELEPSIVRPGTGGSEFGLGAGSWRVAHSENFRYTLIVGSSPLRFDAAGSLKRFEQLGLPTAVLSEQTGTGERYRMAVGQYASASLADAQRQRLSGRIPDGSWVYRYSVGDLDAPEARRSTPPPVAPQPSSAKRSAAWASSSDLRYTLIVTSSAAEADATRARVQYAALGLPMSVLQGDEGNGTRYRLAVGQYATASLADVARQRHLQALPAGTWVHRYSGGAGRREPPQTSAPKTEPSPRESTRENVTQVRGSQKVASLRTTSLWDANPTRRYTVILASSETEAGLDHAFDRYQPLGLPLAVLELSTDTGTQFRLALGQFASADEAHLSREGIDTGLPTGSWVFRYKN
jgi:SPOR domain